MNKLETLEQTSQNQQQLGLLLLVYLQKENYRFTSISPVSHEKVNNRTECFMAGDLVDIFGWNRPFKRETITDASFDLMQSAGIAVKAEMGGKVYCVFPVSMSNSYYTPLTLQQAMKLFFWV